MRNLFFLLVMICFLAACTPAGEPTRPPAGAEIAQPAEPVTPTQGAPETTPTSALTEEAATQTELPAAEATLAPTGTVETPVVVDEQADFVEYTSGGLWLRLESPRDDAEVTTPEITITGYAPAETVISVNEEILLVGEDEHFTFPLKLEEGPNVIELVASSPEGDLIELVLTVSYEKE